MSNNKLTLLCSQAYNSRLELWGKSRAAQFQRLISRASSWHTLALSLGVSHALDSLFPAPLVPGVLARGCTVHTGRLPHLNDSTTEIAHPGRQQEFDIALLNPRVPSKLEFK